MLTHASADWLHAALALIVMTNFALLGAERHRLCIRLIAVQGVIMGVMPLLAYEGGIDLYLACMAGLFLLIKGILLPLLLRRTYLQLPVQQTPEPYVGYSACVLLGAVGLGLSLWLGEQLELAANPLLSLVFPIGMTTILAGLLMIVTRREVLSQLFGYLVMENGIYLLGTPMAEHDSLWLELSILLDILVAVFVMGIAIHHINRAFQSTDVERIAALRD